MCYFVQIISYNVKTPYFIARRIARHQNAGKPSVMERIALLSVAIGVVAMVLSVAVVEGFKLKITTDIKSMVSDVVVSDIRSIANPISAEPIRRSEYTESLISSIDGFGSLVPYATIGGVARTDSGVSSLILKGVDSTFDFSGFERWLIDGTIPRTNHQSGSRDIVLSKKVAAQLNLNVGDRVELLFIESGGALRRDRFKVSGIYSAGVESVEDMLALTNMANVQRLWGWSDNQISGYEIALKEHSLVESYTNELQQRIMEDLHEDTLNIVATSIYERYPYIFGWLETHDINAAVVISIMVIVVLFNLAAALLVLVLERTRMVGTLKSLGMSSGDVRKIFLWRAAFILLRGAAWGNVVAILLCLAQQRWEIVTLSADKYMVSALPISLQWESILILNIAFIAVVVVVMIVPTQIISTIKPEKTIRFE